MDSIDTLLSVPLGRLAMRIFLWLSSVMAVLGLLVLLVLRPSLVFTSESPKSVVTEKSETLDTPAGAICTFPTTME